MESSNPPFPGEAEKEAEQAMSFVNAGSGNPASGSFDAIDVRHPSPHNSV
jgi:hypothetical protein